MKLKLDENLSLRHAAELIRDGHDVTSVVEEGLCGETDRRLLAACQQEGRCLVSLDLDFANPLSFDPRRHAGIAVLRLPARARPDHLAQVLETLRLALESRSIVGRLWIVEIGRIREYQPDNDRL